MEWRTGNRLAKYFDEESTLKGVEGHIPGESSLETWISFLGLVL